MNMKEFEGSVQSLTDTPFGYTLSMIGGKWRLVIMYWLIGYDVIRPNELQRPIDTITYKTLGSQLREMGVGGLLIRTGYPQIPPKVEYRLPEKGRFLYPIMEAIYVWGQEHQGSTK